MSALCGRVAASVVRKHLLGSSCRFYSDKDYETMGDPIDIATGLEKRELLARLAGNDFPFDWTVLKRGPGTKDQPNEIPSAFDARLVGCICVPDALSINYMWLHKGNPRRCECGHWFKLVHKTPL